ncbi:protein of unknown function [Amycolatopsis marina]|uniref:DUF4383 domain-containing protein n=1 Tax=Amycolatopsis marina TaxID=490629 RepID=A0A1I0Y3P6_9PSEU|nr:DUF4383 domain-containing protein [Amycolatopsis marina]SFB07028.1 protein of unknown function [Amycolatopsis marina]
MAPHDVAHYTGRAPVQVVAAAVAVIFLLLGLLGFVPGATSGYDLLAFAGHGSGAMLFGVFAVSVLHNLVHLAFGVVGLTLARAATGARAFLLGGGLAYLVLGIYGLIVRPGSAANFLPVNTADNWLHLGLAVGMLALGVFFGRSTKM